MAAHYWTCQKCGTRHQRTKQLCACGSRRPAARKPKHTAALDVPFEEWQREFGDRCGICGRPPGPNRRLDRDHWHGGPFAGHPRGLLCHRCNRALPDWVTLLWLERASIYLRKAELRAANAAAGREPRP